MSFFFFRHLFLLLFLGFFLSFAACTKGKVAKPFDAESVQGKSDPKPEPKSERTFYLTKSATQAKAIVTEGKGKDGKLFEIASGKVSLLETLTASRITFSQDETLVLIAGQPGIFEYSTVSIAKLAEGTAPPPATVESYCSHISESGYTEFDVVSQNDAYAFVALSAQGKTVIGGNGSITKSEDSRYISFAKTGFGTLVIDKQSPQADPSFFTASFTSAPSPWSSVSQMICHLNNVPVYVAPLATFHTIFVTSTTTDACFGKGSMGGICSGSGGVVPADQYCQAAAAGGTATSGIAGVWKAVISSNAGAAKDRITLIPGAPVKTPNGTTVVTVGTNLWSGSILSAVNTDENGTVLGAYAEAWTGSNSSGTSVGASICDDWSSNAFTSYGETGSTAYTDLNWLDTIDRHCNELNRLYCININP